MSWPASIIASLNSLDFSKSACGNLCDSNKLDNKYLPQRGATFVLNDKDQIIYKYFSNDVLGYSSTMEDPLAFLSEKCK